MDIGAPYKVLGKVDVAEAAKAIAKLPAEAWDRNVFRQDVLADQVHSATKAILFRHEWDRWVNVWGMVDMAHLVQEWARRTKRDPEPFLPIGRDETDIGPIYTFPDWRDFEGVLQPIVDQVTGMFEAKSGAKPGTKSGIVTRLALVMMPPGYKIAPHIDGQQMAHKAHRVHVPLICPPGVEYKVDGKKFTMKLGYAYDFNNRVRHSVRHNGKKPRVNLFLDYYENPGRAVAPPYGYYASQPYGHG